MKKTLGLIALAILGAILSATLVVAIMSITEDRTDRVVKNNRKLREQVSSLIEVVEDNNNRIHQLERVLRRRGIPIPGGGTEQTDSSQQRGAAPR